MNLSIRTMTSEETETLEEKLAAYDTAHGATGLSGQVSLGVFDGDTCIAGADGCMTAFRIFYVSTIYVEAAHRRQGIGRMLMEQMEDKARALGANLIRLDSFDFQGRAFYLALGFEEVGHYESPADGFSESFFLKRLST